MIHFANATEVANFLTRVRLHVGQYSDVVLCSPFIDDCLLCTIRELAQCAPENGCGLKIITSPCAADRVFAGVSLTARRRTRVIACPHLHAKFYVAIGRKRTKTEAIVTSANLTSAGLTSNIELGVRITPTTPQGRTLFEELDRFARQPTFNRSIQWKRQ